MGKKITINKPTNKNPNIRHTIAVDESELNLYLSVPGISLGPADGDEDISINSTRKFVENFVPEDLRFEDVSHEMETLFSKIVSLFEDILSGEVLEKSYYLKQVDELYNYWDVIRNDQEDKVRELLDPLDLSGIVISDTSDLGRFLYYLQSIYSTKGTLKSLQLALRLAGMDAEVIQWYKPEYETYRPGHSDTVTSNTDIETCHSILNIKIGNHPLTDENIKLFERISLLLLDICFTVAEYLFTKNLVDQVDTDDDYKDEVVDHCKENVSLCSIKIIENGDECKYGVYGSADSRWIRAGNNFHHYCHRRSRYKNHNPSDNGNLLHNTDSNFRYPSLVRGICQDNYTTLIHGPDPTLRHIPGGFTRNGSYRYNQYLDYREDVYDLPNGQNITTPATPGGRIPYPRRMSPTYCELDKNFSVDSQEGLSSVLDFGIYHDGLYTRSSNQRYANPEATVLYNESLNITYIDS